MPTDLGHKYHRAAAGAWRRRRSCQGWHEHEAPPAEQVRNTLLRAKIRTAGQHTAVPRVGPPDTTTQCPHSCSGPQKEGSKQSHPNSLPGVPREGRRAVGPLSLWRPQASPLPYSWRGHMVWDWPCLPAMQFGTEPSPFPDTWLPDLVNSRALSRHG